MSKIQIRINREVRFNKLNIFSTEDGKYVELLALCYVTQDGLVCLDDVLYKSKELFTKTVKALQCFDEVNLKGFYVNAYHKNAISYVSGLKCKQELKGRSIQCNFA